MSASANKRLMQHIFDGLAKGDGKAFRDSLAENFRWTVPGTNKWSGTYEGKQSVLNDLMRPLFEQFAGQFTNTAHRFIAEGDYVVVECEGRVTTKTGKPYNNQYCYVCRFADGQLQELNEYMDTQLVATALADPATA